MANITPVSYTHLDVYKRQNLISILEYAGNYTIFDDEQLEEISSLIEACLHQSSEIGADFERNILFMRIILYVIQHLNRRQLSTAAAPSKEFLKVMPITCLGVPCGQAKSCFNKN